MKMPRFGDKLPRKMTIFDRSARRQQEGIEASFRNANSVWKAEAAKRLTYLARTRREFTSDDVIEHLDEIGITTGNNSALGAIFQSASRMGMIQNTGRFQESRRPAQHKAPVRIWRSSLRSRA